MAWQPAPGETLFRPSGPNDHLFVVILGPAVLANYGSGQQLVMVSLTSIKPGLPSDPACEVSPGEHPFIRQPTYVAYRYACIESVDHTMKMLQAGVWRLGGVVQPALLQRIVQGACASRMIPRLFKGLFGCGP